MRISTFEQNNTPTGIFVVLGKATCLRFVQQMHHKWSLWARNHWYRLKYIWRNQPFTGKKLKLIAFSLNYGPLNIDVRDIKFFVSCIIDFRNVNPWFLQFLILQNWYYLYRKISSIFVQYGRNFPKCFLNVAPNLIHKCNFLEIKTWKYIILSVIN